MTTWVRLNRVHEWITCITSDKLLLAGVRGWRHHDLTATYPLRGAVRSLIVFKFMKVADWWTGVHLLIYSSTQPSHSCAPFLLLLNVGQSEDCRGTTRALGWDEARTSARIWHIHFSNHSEGIRRCVSLTNVLPVPLPRWGRSAPVSGPSSDMSYCHNIILPAKAPQKPWPL